MRGWTRCLESGGTEAFPTSMTPLANTMNQTDPNAADASRAGGAEDEPPQPPGDGAVVLDITDTTDSLGSAPLAWLERLGVLAIGEAVDGAPGPHSVELSIVDDATMAELHLFHSGVEGTTDVLTFDLREGSAGPLDVEIVVCLDEARRMAGAGSGGCAVERELLLYLLHGALHCLGHDDHDPEGFARMHEREDEILRAIGVGAVFDERSGGGGGSR